MRRSPHDRTHAPALLALLAALWFSLVPCRAARGLEVFQSRDELRAFLGLPGNYPIPKVPPDNLLSREGVALGRFLFYDKRLSGNGTQACASCHEQARAFTDGLPVGVGSTGEHHPRNSMSLTNVAYASFLAWANPSLLQLEQQTAVPLFGKTPIELGLSGEEELLDRLRADARYRRLFAEAFPAAEDPFSKDNVLRAISSFDRTLISKDSPYDDYFFRFDDSALSESALRGIDLFFTERFECFHCHGGTNFTLATTFVGKAFDEDPYTNNGLYNIDGLGAFPPNNRGIMETTLDPRDMGRFKPPTLRNIMLTAPYMHDGSMATLEEVLVDQYGHGGRLTTEGPYAGDGSTSPLKSPFVRGFVMTDQEKEDLLNLFRSLTDERFVTNPRFSDPFVAPSCVADCNLDEEVTPSDMVDAVNVALETASLARCLPAETSGDGQITVDELVRAVKVSIEGCSS